MLSVETLEPRTLLHAAPHMGDPVLQAEHDAVFDLFPQQESTAFAVLSGDWSDPSIWAWGQTPVDGDRVLVPEWVTLTVDGETSRVFSVRVDGTLRFDTAADTHLQVETLLVSPGGNLEMGTQQNPVAGSATVTFLDSGPIDVAWDPLVLSRGAILHGHTEIVGAEVTGHQDAIGPAAGATTIELVAPVVGWDAGDRILVPGVVRPNENFKGETTIDQDEIVSIVSVDGNTVTIDQPLQYSHVPPRPELRYPVANLDRNVVFKSESHEDQREGHVMFMHNPDVDVKFASFQNGGRNDKSKVTTDGGGDNARGRYAAHFHRTGLETQASIEGSVVEGGKGWGFVNHDSNVLFKDNVTYAVKGAGFVAEIGREQGAFENNLAVRSTGRHFQQLGPSDKGGDTGLGSAGHGFWVQSPGVALQDNVAAGHAQEGIFLHGLQQQEFGRDEPVFYPVELVLAGTELPPEDAFYNADRTGINPQKVPYVLVEGNSVFASGTGLGTRWHRRPTTEGTGDVIEDLDIWNVKWSGIRMGYTGGVLFKDIFVYGNASQPIKAGPQERNDPNFWADLPEGKGVSANVNSHNLTFEDLAVEGFNVGLLSLRKGDTIVNGGYFDHNDEDIRILTAQATQAFDGRRVHLVDIVHGGNSTWNLRLIKQLDRLIFGVTGEESLEFESILDDDEILHNGVRIYFHDQAPDAVPFPSEGDLPYYMSWPEYSQYLDKTNQELFDEFGIALGGLVAPGDALDDPLDKIDGLK